MSQQGKGEPCCKRASDAHETLGRLQAEYDEMLYHMEGLQSELIDLRQSQRVQNHLVHQVQAEYTMSQDSLGRARDELDAKMDEVRVLSGYLRELHEYVQGDLRQDSMMNEHIQF